jgi:Ser/Thr protein kinase RdoA (MazF antagonist)
VHSYTGWVDPADLERHSDDGAELLRRCRAAVERADLRDTGDLVHWDYTTSNVLVADGRVTGIVDWDGALNGDRIFDVATLFYYTRTPLLRDYALEQRDERVFAAYLAHMILRQTGWSIRYHEPDAGTQLVRDGLELSKTFPG